MDEEKVVLITGGAKRIGACIARYFHAKGFYVILHFNSSSREAEQLKSDLLSIRKNSCSRSSIHLRNKMEMRLNFKSSVHFRKFKIYILLIIKHGL